MRKRITKQSQDRWPQDSRITTMSSFYLLLLLQLSNVALALPASRLALLSPVNVIIPNDTFNSAEPAVKGQSDVTAQSLNFLM